MGISLAVDLAAGLGWIGKVAEVGISLVVDDWVRWIRRVAEVGISLPVDLAAGLGGSRGCFGNQAGVFTNKGTTHLLNGSG